MSRTNDVLLSIDDSIEDNYWDDNNVCYKCGNPVLEFSPWRVFGPNGKTYPVCESEECNQDDGNMKKEVR